MVEKELNLVRYETCNLFGLVGDITSPEGQPMFRSRLEKYYNDDAYSCLIELRLSASWEPN